MEMIEGIDYSVNTDKTISGGSKPINNTDEFVKDRNESNEKDDEEDKEVVAEIAPENIIEDVVAVDDYHTGIYTDVNRDFIDKDMLISMPVLMHKDLLNFAEDSNTIDPKQYARNSEIAMGIITALGGINYYINPSIYKDIKFSDKTITKDMKFKDKVISPVGVNVVNGSNKRVAVDRLRKVIRSGKNVQVPLWNTGIRVTISVPPVNDIYNLKKKLRNLNVESDLDTGGMLYSNKKIILTTEIINFINGFIMDYTLDIPAESDKVLMDYIRLEDIPLLITAISIALFPNGNNTTLTCENTKYIESGIPKCSYVVNAKINPIDLIRIDTKRVTDTMLDIISRRNSGSVSIEDLVTYRNEFMAGVDDKLVISHQDDEEVLMFNFESKDVNSYIEIGNIWVDDITTRLFDIGNLSQKDKKIELDRVIELNVLGAFNTYVSSITVGDDVYTDRETINEMLNEASQDNHLYNKFMEKIVSFVSYNSIAIIGTNNFICPVCAKKQKEEGTPFELDYIWLEPLTYFLEVANLKLTNMQKRQMV